MPIESFQYLVLLFRVNTGQNSLYIRYFHTLLSFNANNCVFIFYKTQENIMLWHNIILLYIISKKFIQILQNQIFSISSSPWRELKYERGLFSAAN